MKVNRSHVLDISAPDTGHALTLDELGKRVSQKIGEIAVLIEHNGYLMDEVTVSYRVGKDGESVRLGCTGIRRVDERGN